MCDEQHQRSHIRTDMPLSRGGPAAHGPHTPALRGSVLARRGNHPFSVCVADQQLPHGGLGAGGIT
jgi:hypothetical protein